MLVIEDETNFSLITDTIWEDTGNSNQDLDCSLQVISMQCQSGLVIERERLC